MTPLRVETVCLKTKQSQTQGFKGIYCSGSRKKLSKNIGGNIRNISNNKLVLEKLRKYQSNWIPPRQPINCNNFDNSRTISNAYGTWPDRIPCKASMVIYPSTEEEILHAVADVARKKLKMKVVTGFSHTIPKLACPGSGDGAGILISTQNYKNEITVDKAAMTVTADSGVGLRDLLDAVAASGLALVAAPYWDGLSLGGLLSTSSHGSSLWHRGGAVHDYVVSMRLVVPASQGEGYAKVITLRPGDPDLNAAKVSLGVLGVISKVTLALEPQFKRNVTNMVKDDADLEDDILPFAAAHEFGDLTWYPSQREVVYRMDDRVPVTAPGNGFNDFIGFQSTAMAAIAGIRATESTLKATRIEKGKCMLARGIVASKLALANGLKNNEFMFTGYPVVGFQNRMQTSGSCQRSPSADFLPIGLKISRHVNMRMKGNLTPQVNMKGST